MITSVNNGQVKNIIQLNQKTKARREQGLFISFFCVIVGVFAHTYCFGIS